MIILINHAINQLIILINNNEKNDLLYNLRSEVDTHTRIILQVETENSIPIKLKHLLYSITGIITSASSFQSFEKQLKPVFIELKVLYQINCNFNLIQKEFL